MKKKLLLLLLLAATFFTNAQNVGIGTTTPLARLHITDSSVLFSATGGIPVTPGLPPLQGEGRRMMWYADKAAFRAGYVDGTQWDKDNTGVYSAAFGYNNTAFGFASVALGYNTAASGSYSTSIGNSTIASGDYSVATGSGTNAVGSFSTALGVNTTASGYISTAVGNSTTAKSGFETVMGRWNTDYTPANTSNGWVSTDRLFTIGNGISSSSRSDALIILKNGNMGIGTSTPGFPLSFAPTLGDKISLWSNSANSYGFGIQGGLLQIHTDISDADIAFGYGSSSSFSERMRIKNQLTSGTGMELNGRLVMRNGTVPLDPNYGPGVWLTKADNSGALLGFMGTQNNQNIGFYGGPAGWGFTYDAINSRVGIGTSTPAATLEVNGYTKLGSDAPAAPAIKMIKLTGTTAATQGGNQEAFHTD